MNRVDLIGRLTRDNKLDYTTSGKAFLKNAIAVDRRGEGTDFINLIAWEKTAEFMDKHFKKGSRLGISGRLQSSSYTDKEGKNRTSIDVVVEAVDFCESKNETNNSDNEFLSVPDGLVDDLPFS